MDAEVISAGVLREALDSGLITMEEINADVGASTGQLIEQSLQIKDAPSEVEPLDDEGACKIREHFLDSYDIRAMVVELAVRLDMQRYLSTATKPQQQRKSLEVMKVYAPLAHAIGATALSLEMEDISLRYLFPESYGFISGWLKDVEADCKVVMDEYKQQLVQDLGKDEELNKIVRKFSVKARIKTSVSAMKKLLRDGRKPEDVHDLLGMRVILDPKPEGADTDPEELGVMACYKTNDIIRSKWKEIPHRTKDYIAKPKGAGGYKSLHVAIDISEPEKPRPMMEVQIRTAEMDKFGNEMHSLYKGGVNDPEEAKHMKEVILAAADKAAGRLRDAPSSDQGELMREARNRAFRLLDKDGDGRICIKELTEVMEELGAGGEDAEELMRLLDVNNDGTLSAEEFDCFEKQVKLMKSLEQKDDHYRTVLKEKLKKEGDGAGLIHVYRRELSDKLQ